MVRVSPPTGILLALGGLLIILAGFSLGQDRIPDWVSGLQYFLFVVGIILVVEAIVLILRRR
ncbi:hypothetical protein EU527_16170 [Candidatus Thorarchaeota archaeon]|nr:MAG: hypothetical protein EU527_16170 [Candidatus Thorarchaeota archaeon]